jgi:hypothetical protein
MLKIAATLILLHSPGGGKIWVNPEEVTSLRSAKSGEEGKHFTEEAHCLISLGDGKFVTVVERCDDVQNLMEFKNERDR